MTELLEGVWSVLLPLGDLMEPADQFPKCPEILEPQFHSELFALEKCWRVKGDLRGQREGLLVLCEFFFHSIQARESHLLNDPPQLLKALGALGLLIAEDLCDILVRE